MFRTAARSFAASAWRSAESISQLEAANQTAINISKAQGIGQRGFLDGKLYLFYELI
jgi:cysteine synthase A